MYNLLKDQLDYIFFFYGLSFIFLFAVCRVLGRAEPKSAWRWLGYFGLVHGINEWLDLVSFSLFESPVFSLIRFFFLSVSFIFLIEFGRRTFITEDNGYAGILIYFPLLMLTGTGGFYGLGGLSITVRYFLGFSGGVLSAYGLFRSASAEKGFARKNLLICSASFLLYSIASGIFVKSAPFFPASFINQELFADLTGFPVQFLRAALACAVTVSLWNYYNIKRFGYEDELYTANIFHLKWGLSVVFAAVILGWGLTSYIGSEAHKNLRYSCETETVLLANRIGGYLLGSEISIKTLSISPHLVSALESPDAANIEKANITLDAYNAALKDAVCYLLNRDGTVIASSNRDAADSFVGKSYSFRPYFKNAMAKKMATYFARGVTSNKRGYYAAMPVNDGTGTVIGVACVKRNIDEVEKDFSRYENCFLINPEGIIFASSNVSVLFRSLWPLGVSDKEALTRAGQFEKIIFEPLLGAEPKNNSYVDQGGRRLWATRQFINDEKWSAVVFYSTVEIGAYRLFSIIIICSLCIIVISSVTWLQLVEEASFKNLLEQRRHAEKLLASEQYNRALIENTSDMITLIDETGVITYQSPSVEKILGHKPEEMKGNLLLSFAHEQDLAPLTKLLNEEVFPLCGDAVQTTYRMKHKNGSYRDIESVFKNLMNFEPVKGITINSRDITERIKMEQEYLKESKLESLGVLAGGIAHDFNNVLMGIVTNIGLVKKRLGPSEKNFEILQRAEDAAYSAKNITSQFITFAKGGVPVKKIVEMPEFLKTTANLVTGGSSATCEFEKDGERLAAEVDEVQMSQVFTNIIINAIQAMRDGGVIKIKTARLRLEKRNSFNLVPGDYIKISVKDAGCGIEPKMLDKIFDPYVSTKADGNGLGLASAFSIVKNHGGAITVESKLRSGSTFEVYLPAAAA